MIFFDFVIVLTIIFMFYLIAKDNGKTYLPDLGNLRYLTAGCPVYKHGSVILLTMTEYRGILYI